MSRQILVAQYIRNHFLYNGSVANLILPGLIDPHVHLRDPGQTEKEDFYTGTTAALAGGYTTVLDMPNNKIPVTSEKILDEKIAIAKEKIVCAVGFFFGSMGDNLEEFEKVTGKVHGLKLYLDETTGNYVLPSEKLANIYQAWSSANGPILVHAEEKKVEAVITIVRKTGKRTHICHISLALELEMIIQAKQEGLPITCGVTPHHLFSIDNDEKHLGPFGKMKPPLRSKKDVAFLWKNLSAIDVIESDHAPHTIEEKQSSNPPYGVPGLETTLPLLLTATSENRLTIDDVIRLCHTNPAKIFGIKTDRETNVEIDPDSSFTIHQSSLLTKCRWSPFNGWKVKGNVIRVFIRGTKVFEEGKILAKPGFGRIL